MEEEPVKELLPTVTDDQDGQGVSGGIPLRDYTAKDAKVAAVIKQAKEALPPHMLDVLVDFDGWSAEAVESRASALCVELKQQLRSAVGPGLHVEGRLVVQKTAAAEVDQLHSAVFHRLE